MPRGRTMYTVSWRFKECVAGERVQPENVQEHASLKVRTAFGEKIASERM